MWGTGAGNSFEQLILVLFNESNLKSKEKEFKGLEDPSQRVDLVYNSIKKLKQFQASTVESQDRKSNKESDELRTQGNEYYIRNRNYLGALECYTKSIALAESGSSFLALAYGNRSAVLFERSYYKECLEDIDRALALEYPENLKEKLLNRKAKAENQKNNQKPVRYYDNPPIVESQNPQVTCASDAIEIQYNEQYGRHVIATKNIKIGDVVSAENSFCHVIHQESKYVHCHQCLELCYNMIPCENCASSLYCSKECKEKCFEEYHKYECQFPKLLLANEMVYIKLALIGMKESKRTENNIPDDNIHRSDSFKEIIKLAMNEEKRNYTNLCIPTIAASIAYRCLKEIQEFVSVYDSEEDDQNLKRFLYQSYMINAFNPFNIKKIRYTQFDIKSKRVGTALYAFTSLYNHSCVPNCEFFHYGTLLVTRAQANIKKGEQLTICYGISFSTTLKSTRQAILKKNYLFDCDCKACSLNWPKMNFLKQGKQLPLAFEMKSADNDFSDSESNKKLMEELLKEGKNLYQMLEKQQPCQNLLKLQNMITEIYTYQACKDVQF